MAELTDRLMYKARREIRYTRGMQCMYRERYFVYLEDLRNAREARDFKRMAQISKDMHGYTKEVRHLMERQRIAFERLAHIRRSGDTQTRQDKEPAATPSATHSSGLRLVVGKQTRNTDVDVIAPYR